VGARRSGSGAVAQPLRGGVPNLAAAPGAEPQTLRTEVHRGPLEPLLPEWERLFEADDEATPFSSPEWARAWWPHWAGAASPFLVAVRDGDRLVGLAPLVLARRGPFRVLTELGRPPSNYWDVLSEPAVRAEAGALALRELGARGHEWHALLLGGVRTGSATEQAVLSAGLRLRRRRPSPYPGIELPATFEEYLGGLPRKRRKDLRRHMRRLEDGRLELRDVTEPSELTAAMQRWQDIRVRWWQHRGKRMDPEHASTRFRDFMRDLVALMVPRGLAQVWELRYEGAVVGVEVNLADRRTYYSWMGAYDPSAAHLGLGKLAIGESIRASIAAGREYYDLMVGDEDYKYWYGATDRHCRWTMAGTGRAGSRIALAAGAVADAARRVA
jgi:CelD/BcsL family acetyltransferase involved in cellulose biosynthesis